MNSHPYDQEHPADGTPETAYLEERCEMKQRFLIVTGALVALVLGMFGSVAVAQQADLRKLVDKEDEAFLLSEIQRIQPYYAIRHLARFQQMQNSMGGGFCGCLPEQLLNADEIPLPVDKAGVVETATYLARQREVNLAALAELGFPSSLPSAPFDGIPPAERSPSLTVSIDTSVPTAFLDALIDGEVTMAEARVIARLPANQEMLRFICDRCVGAEPRVSEQTLAYLIWKAGSQEPLDRLWRWVNPMNDLGYAGLADEPARYRELIDDLNDHRQKLANAAVARIAPFLPYGTEMTVRFAFIPGCLTGDWRTLTMSGSSVLRIGAGWEEVVQRISEGIFHHYLMQLGGGSYGIDRQALLDVAGFTDDRFEITYDLVVSTVLEGSVDYVSGPSTPVDTSVLAEGIDLVNRLVLQMQDESSVGSARVLLEQGRGPGGPLVAVGNHMARLIVEHDGPLAVTELLAEGCVGLFRRALEIDSEGTDARFDRELFFMVDEVSERQGR